MKISSRRLILIGFSGNFLILATTINVFVCALGRTKHSENSLTAQEKNIILTKLFSLSGLINGTTE